MWGGVEMNNETEQIIEKDGKKYKVIEIIEEEWIKIPEKGIEITSKQHFNGKTYAEILEEVEEEQIATYELLQELRNKGYEFLKDFWVFVPNPDKISKENNYVAWFVAVSDRAGLDCDRDPSYSSSSLGVFLIRKIKRGKK